MDGNKGRIATQFEGDDADRQTRLENLRDLAAYTIPSILPERNIRPDQKLEQTFQSIASRGVANLEGRLLTSLFPTSTFWARFTPTEIIRQEPTHNEQVASVFTGNTVTRLQAFEEQLFLRELAVQRFLDGTNYRNAFRIAIRSLLILGSSLTKMTDAGRFKTFREDQYVLNRDPDEELVYLITREKKDALYLPDEVLAQIDKKPDELKAKTPRERQTDIYTQAVKQRSGGWVVEQEIEGKIVNESQEKVSPYIVGAYDLLSGENYGRSFAELNMGDIRSANGLNRAALGIAAVMARILGVIDDTAGTTQRDDLTKRADGEFIYGRVENGVARDVAFIQANKFGDLQGVLAVMARVEDRLSKAMLVESEIQPTGDRVTAFQVARLAQELEGALGGIYAAVAERLQRPLIERVLWHMERQKLLTPLPKEAVNTQTLTGLEALNRERDLQKLNLLFQMLGTQQGAAMLESLDLSAVARRTLQLMELDPTNIVKSKEQVAKDRAAALEQQLRMEAAQQAIATTGNIAEQQAASQAVAA